MSKPMVGIIMGSQSDLKIMAEAALVLEELGIASEVTVASAHRTPERTIKYVESAESRGLKTIIAGAGGAAHLAGVAAAVTTLPIIAVPIRSEQSLAGLDSLLSMVQMPAGIPVATVAINGGRNAGILAAQIIGTADPKISQKLKEFKKSLASKVEKSAAEIESKGYKNFI